MATRSRFALVGLFIFIMITPAFVKASDHDDGEMDLKGRSVNLTDLYAFREDWQTSGGTSGNMVLIMNTNPRSLPHQQYFFSTQAVYDFHLGRVGTASSKAVTSTGLDNIIIRFTFGNPDVSASTSPTYNMQTVTVQTIRDGVSDGSIGTNLNGSNMLTTSLANSQSDQLTFNTFSIGGTTMKMFAGLRQDPFFFDVARFFNVRAGLAGAYGATPGTSVGPGFAGSQATAADFTTGYNVNTIVIDLPIAFLQKNGETVYDVWETISIPQ
jgi:hypothetical protein